MASVLSALLCGAVAANNGVLVLGGMAVGMVDNGKWSSFAIGEEPLKPSQAKINQLAQGTSWRLEPGGAVAGLTKLSVVDFEPMGKGWGTGEEDEFGDYWIGAKPAKIPTTTIPKNNSIYLKVMRDFAASKGMRGANIVVDSIIQADLDANGTKEVILTFGSEDVRKMQGVLNPYGAKFPRAFSAVIIRYVGSRGARTLQVHWEDGRKHGITFSNWVTDLWDLDGVPGAEILMENKGWESNGYEVVKFSRGATKVVAANGWGV